MNIIQFIRREPAAVSLVANGVVALVAGWVFHLDPIQMGLVTTISTGLMTALTAYLATPPSLALEKGGLATALAAFAAFKMGIPAQFQAEIVTALSIILGLNLRENLTPRIAK